MQPQPAVCCHATRHCCCSFDGGCCFPRKKTAGRKDERAVSSPISEPGEGTRPMGFSLAVYPCGANDDDLVPCRRWRCRMRMLSLCGRGDVFMELLPADINGWRKHVYLRRYDLDTISGIGNEKKKKKRWASSNCTFRSCDLRVMSPARFHCAKLLCDLLGLERAVTGSRRYSQIKQAGPRNTATAPNGENIHMNHCSFYNDKADSKY